MCSSFLIPVSEPDLGLWNSMLSACSTSGGLDGGLSMEVLCFFSHMQKGAKAKANEVSFVALINACADLGAFSRCIWAHCYVVKNNMKLNRFFVTSLIDLCVNCGFLEFVLQVFDEMPKKDMLCYNAMIRGFATQHKAVDLFENMVSRG
ncbi:putative tetratricopeptide-like helical domain superfamily [Helianthus annuus]|nr:putative tetratricopeptide-like helical domain superfamily [Helianthus annuus]